MIYKNKDVKTNVDNETTEISNPNTFFYTEDKGTASLRLFINWQNKPVNLNKTTMKPSLDLFHSDGSIWLNEALEVIMAEKGMVQYNIPSNVIKHAGNVNAKLFLKSDEKSIHVANFSFNIVDSGVEGKVQKEISVNLVEDSVRKIVKENAMELLDDNFKVQIYIDLQNYVNENIEKFKGPKGDQGEQGSIKFDNLTTEQKNELKADATDYSKLDSLMLNQGKEFPLLTFKLDDVDTSVAAKVKDCILDVKIYGAQKNKVYQLDSVRDNYKGVTGLVVSSYDLPTNGNLKSVTKQQLIGYSNGSTIIDDKNATIRTITSSQNGITAVVTVDRPKLATIINISENINGSSQGTIISPTQYIYANDTNIGSLNILDTDVIVDKKENEFVVYIPTRLNTYTGIKVIRRTEPFKYNVKGSNMDLWAIARISNYKKENDLMIEKMVHIYSPYNPSDLTQDTMLKETGATDYSGGFYHGDEKINKFSIYVGNADITNRNGLFTGSHLTLIQDNNIYHNTYGKENADTTAYVNLKKTHKFDSQSIYTLMQRFYFLESVKLNFSNFGALSMKRVFENGQSNNFNNVLNLSEGENIDIKKGDGVLYFQNTNSKEFLISGFYKDVLITYESDSDYHDAWVNNNLNADPKLYSKMVPTDSTVEKGKIINTKVNYKFIGYQ